MTKICLVPKVSGVGGMVSFRGRFASGVDSRGYKVIDRISSRNSPCDTILVIGGTRDIPALRLAKVRGIRIVQRLNGMNWLHRKLKTGVKHYLRAEYGNLVLRLIRSTIADHIVYQSEFAKGWWERTHGLAPVPSSVVYNGVDLNIYSPGMETGNQDFKMPEDRYRILIVEGSLLGGYEMGVDTAVGLVETLNETFSHELGKPVELMIAGRVSEKVKSNWSRSTEIPITWAGLVSPDKIPALDASAHLLFSSDINAACPNSVIEALACGVPVLAFNTGALPEMVSSDSGKVIPYGGNPWKLEKPDIQALSRGGVEILKNQVKYRAGARERAESTFGLTGMVDGYLDALLVR
jgi:glycosyltransferase involved in cell wall biosynthesis